MSGSVHHERPSSQSFVFPGDQLLPAERYETAMHQGYSASAATIIGAIDHFTGIDDETIEHQKRAWTAHGLLDHLVDSGDPDLKALHANYRNSLFKGNLISTFNDASINDALVLYRNSVLSLPRAKRSTIINGIDSLARISPRKRYAATLGEYSMLLVEESMAAAQIIESSTSEKVSQHLRYDDFRRWLFYTAHMAISADSAYDLKKDFMSLETALQPTFRTRLALGSTSIRAGRKMLLSSPGAPLATFAGLKRRFRYGLKPEGWRQKVNKLTAG